MLGVGIGASEDAEAESAGRHAAAAALDELSRSGLGAAALVIVYSSVRYDLPTLLRAVRQVTGEVPLVGSTSAGHLYRDELMPPGHGVVVLALSAGPYRFGVASVTGLGEDSCAAGRELVRAARAGLGAGRGPYAAVLVLTDGLTGDQQALLNGVHRVAGAAVPVIGGVAGDDRNLTGTFVFHGDRVLSDAAVAVWIESPRPLQINYGHGWRAEGLPLLVTGVDGTVIKEIAGRSAVEVLREHFRDDRLDVLFGSVRSSANHSAHAFGVIEPDGRLLVRGAFLDGPDTVRTFAPLPLYSAIQVVSCRQDDLLDVGERVVERISAGPDVSVVLLFSCVARFDILAERFREEAARIQAAAGGVPVFGFHTYGEFARTGGVSGYHNATVAAIAL
ncbi:MAG: hypothetical protein GXX79_04870 [Actinomycetales bacterium]|nr:hypothetical protein [Actinomycetales bacterium]